MRKIFTDVLKRQLPLLFAQRFSDFTPYRPKQTAEEKEKFPLPLATDYFRRIRGPLWEIIGIRRYSQDEWTLEIFWSIQARFPSSRLNCDYGIVNIEELLVQPEAHTCSRDIVRDGNPTDWPVWLCSLPFNDPDYQKRYVVEYLQPVAQDVAERKVAEQLKSTADVIEKFVLPLFAEVEKHMTGTAQNS